MDITLQLLFCKYSYYFKKENNVRELKITLVRV